MKRSQRAVNPGLQDAGRKRTAARLALLVLMGLTLSSLSAYAATGTLSARVPADGAQRADTLVVGEPGYVDVTINLDAPDSIEAVVLAMQMQFTPGPAQGINRITIDDWEWFGAYQNFAFRGFDSAYQDGGAPDSGLMYALVMDSPSAYSDDPLVARFWVTASAEGTLVIDTLRLRAGLVQHVTGVHLFAGGTIDVTNNLAFDFPPIAVVAAAACPFEHTGDVNGDGKISSADIRYLNNYLNKDGPEPVPCLAAGDVNCDGQVTSEDQVFLANYVFKKGDPPCSACDLILDGTWTCP